MEKTWKPLTAGVLMIIAGVLGISKGAEAATGLFPSWFWWFSNVRHLDAGLIAAGIVAIIGGVFALQRKLWPMALAGAILTFPCNWLFGLLSLIWVAQSRKEFTGYQ